MGDGGDAGQSFSETINGGRTGVHYLAKCVLKGSAVLHAAQGHLRSPSSLDVVLGKETSIELVVVGEDGIVQSICEQTVFGIIKDMAILCWNKNSHTSNPQGKDLLVVLSDSGKLSFLMFCTEMDRFFPVTHIQLSKPGNSRHQLGRMLAVDSNGCFVAVSAYDDQFALLSVSTSTCSNIVGKKFFYPPENKGGASLEKVHGTIWSMCFVSKGSHQSREDVYNPILAVIMHRRDDIVNDLLLFGCNTNEDTIHMISQYSEPGPLAVSISEVPHLPGFALIFRVGDAILMDLSDPCNPCCIYRTGLNIPRAVEESVDESSRSIEVDDEGISACALLALRDSGEDVVGGYDPMCIDSGNDNSVVNSKLVCSWSWEPTKSTCSRIVICLDSGELCMLEIHSETEEIRVNLHSSLYKGFPCKALLWVRGGFIAAFVEMGDGIVLKLENCRLSEASPIQNIAPILDMSFVDYHDEKQDQIFACCGVGSEGSLRIIRSGVSVEKLLRTPPVYQGITGTWALKMKETNAYHSFLVLSFVEETRVLSVGLSFVDVSDAVGFQPNACTLACGLLSDGLLVQIHRTEVRLCLLTSSAHPDGIPLSAPICTSWYPDNVSISLGAVGHNLIVVATSSPCCLFILGVRSLSAYQYEIFEVQRARLHNEISCISIPHKTSKHDQLATLADQNHEDSLPTGLEICKTFVIGTHKPSVEILQFVPEEGIKVLAIGTISINNAQGIPITGCIPEDVRLVFVDRYYLLSGLRNGMLLRFEWPVTSLPSASELPMQAPFFANHFSEMDISPSCAAAASSIGLQYSAMKKAENPMPVYLQLIAIRRIGITPVFLVPLSDSLDSDIIALSDRPWLLQTARHSLAYTSISCQPATHLTPVSSTDCPKGVLFVAENSLHLVEIVQSKRLNVQKFHHGGTPRKVLYHSESKTLFVMRIGLTGDSCSSDICRVDPLSGSLLSRFKFEHGETAKCMQIVNAGNEQVLIVGTSQTVGHAIMPSGEAESAKGRLVVISLQNTQDSDSSSLIFCSNMSPQVTSPFREIVGYATEQLSSSSICSSPDDNICEGVKHEEFEAGQLKLINAKSLSGVVMSICPYLDRYFLVSAGNILSVFGFLNDNPHRLRRFTSARTRFTITCLTTHLTRIAVGDCRDGILFFSYQEDQRKLEQLYCDPMQRLVADCVLMDLDTAVASDRRGSISILSCSQDAEDNANPECNLTQSCSYYMGETVMTIRKGSFSYKLPEDDGFKGCDGEIIPDSSSNIIVATTLLGSVMMLIPISSEVYDLLKAVQAILVSHPLTAPILGNDHSEFRRRGSPVEVPTILDGDMLAQFLELTSMQQESVIASFNPQDNGTSSSSQMPISASQVVQLLERVHYALN